MKKILSTLCLTAFMANTMNTHAQDNTALDYKALRTDTWSVYVQGGASWATGLKFKSINPASGTSIAPEVGFGVNYNLRPWVRLGLNYEFSKYKREQRLDKFEAVSPSFNGAGTGLTENTANNGGIAYRKLWNMYHNIDLTAEFNIMELWPSRKCTLFNLYAGTGVGMMFAKGNTYTLGMGNEQWEDPNNANGTTDNWSSHTWLKADNSRHNYNSFYVPVVVSAEYDVMPQLTLGVKGQYKALFTSDDFAPSGLEAAAVVVRYNFVGPKQGVLSTKQLYREALDKCNELRSEAAQARDAEARSKNALNAVNAENKNLKQQLNVCSAALTECEAQKAAPVILNGMTILFANNSAVISQADEKRLVAFAEELKNHDQATINLVGEASAEGDSAKNQILSEKRLANVVAILNKNGVSNSRISSKAIGDANKVPGASNRRVEITIIK